MKFTILALTLGFLVCPRYDTAHAGRYRLATELDRPLYEQEFGLSVAAFGDRVVVASESRCGGAFLFDATTGALLRSLRDEVPCVGTLGQALAAAGQRFAVSARGLQRVYLFDADGGLERILSSEDLDPNDNGFGWSVALGEAVAVVGGSRAGVYVLDPSSGRTRFRISNPGPDESGLGGFGAAVAVTAGTILVGNPVNGVIFGFDGERGTELWRRQVRVTSNGWIILAADSGYVAVGGVLDDKGRDVVLLLLATTGEVRQRYRARGRRQEGFGSALALHGERLLVGGFVRHDIGVISVHRLGRRHRIAAVRAGKFNGRREGWLALAGDHLVVGVPEEDRVGIFTRRARRK